MKNWEIIHEPKGKYFIEEAERLVNKSISEGWKGETLWAELFKARILAEIKGELPSIID